VNHVTLRTDKGVLAQLPMGVAMQKAAMRWNYVARYRHRWNKSLKARDDLGRQLQEELAGFGLSEGDLRRLAESGIIEVGVPYTDEEQGWEGRILPWEYVLSAATRDFRDGPFTIVRHLQRKTESRVPSRQSTKKLLLVEFAPGALRESISFGAEEKQIQASSGLQAQLLQDPQEEELRRKVVAIAPQVVHLAGVDNHQAAELLGIEEPASGRGGPGDAIQDGLPFTRRGTPPVDFLGAQESARLLTAARVKPQLVTCNLYHSGGRLAALLVAEGAGAAIGFQDTFDDASAELFFATFYRSRHEARGDILLAFQIAWLGLRDTARPRRGTGIVLWSASSLLAKRAVEDFSRSLSREQGRMRDLGSVSVSREEITRENLRRWVQVKVQPHREINYSLLHNDQDIFESFEISKLADGRIDGLSVEVILHVGSDSFPYRTSVDLDQAVVSLTSSVRLPLTSSLIRTVGERVYTSLYVEIKLGDLEIYRETHRVALLPVDEWRYDWRDYVWLPSFVLPRDPAVARVIDLAQRYLNALADDIGAGFDGYQSVDESTGDATCVDSQVQAIWWAILQDAPLSYINPPPSYTESGQRLRTPGRVLHEHRGTCVDLALLVAACLEYVEIYPVIFLFEGHACPGYWRSEKTHEAFLELTNVSHRVAVDGDSAEAPGSGRASKGGPREPYISLRDAHGEIRNEIRQGNLVPLEAVALTGRCSVAEAVEQGRENLVRVSEFEAMIDLASARKSGITPLPLVEELS